MMIKYNMYAFIILKCSLLLQDVYEKDFTPAFFNH